MRRVRRWKMAALRWHAVEWALSPAGEIGWLTTAASARSSLFPAPIQDCWESCRRPREIPSNIHISSFLRRVSSPPLEDCVCLCSMPGTGCPEKIWIPGDVQGPVGWGFGQSDLATLSHSIILWLINLMCKKAKRTFIHLSTRRKAVCALRASVPSAILFVLKANGLTRICSDVIWIPWSSGSHTVVVVWLEGNTWVLITRH